MAGKVLQMRKKRPVAVLGACIVVVAGAATAWLVRHGEGETTGVSRSPAASPTVSAGETIQAAPNPIPATVPGVTLAPVELGTYRISLVFRLRNTILNGLPGHASDYTLKTVQARRGGESGLLIGIAAVPGASVPAVGPSVRALIGTQGRGRRSGRLITRFRVSGYELAVVDAEPRRAFVVIAPSGAVAQSIAQAVARAIPTPP